MSYVIRKVTDETSIAPEMEGPPPQYLEWSDPNGRFGLGSDLWTGDVNRAIHFVTTFAALAYWRRQSTLQPLRPDGKPNRPLTAYHVLIEPHEQRETA